MGFRNIQEKLENISLHCDFFLLLEIFYRYTLEKRSALIIRGKTAELAVTMVLKLGS